MAQARKNSTGRGSSSAGKRNSGRGNNQRRTTNSRNHKSEPMDVAIRNEIILIALFAVAVFLFLCNFGIAGVMGNTVSDVMFGIFGLTAYIMPLALFFMIAFGMVNSGSSIAARKLVAGVLLFLIAGILCELFSGAMDGVESYQAAEIYFRCSENHSGGGVLAGSLAYFCHHFMGMIGTILILLVIAIISIVILTEKSFVSGVKSGGRKVYERSREDAAYRRERAELRRREQEEERKRREEEKKLREEERENEKILRMDKKITGVMMDTTLTEREEVRYKERDDIHEINLTDFEEQIEQVKPEEMQEKEEEFDFHQIRINSAYLEEEEGNDELSEITELYAEEETPEPVYEREAQMRLKTPMYKEPLPFRSSPKGSVLKNTYFLLSVSW